MSGTQQPLAAAPVTILDVFTKQVEMQGQLGIIHEQLKALPDHEARIRSLESSKAKLYGGAIAISAVISSLGTWIVSGLTHH